jgi:hypothetical protein
MKKKNRGRKSHERVLLTYSKMNSKKTVEEVATQQ